MKQKWKKPSVILSLLALLFTSFYAQGQSIEKEIATILAKYTAGNEPGASVLVFKEDKIVFKKGYGVKRIGLNEKIDSKTNFRLASLTKQFTAMSIMLLVKNKKIKLDDPITKYFALFPSYGKDIKIKNLLTHTSGLKDYEDLIPSNQTIQLHDTNCLQLMYLVDDLYFAPGSQYKYSNTGYAILALIVEKVSGQDFASFVKENIFKPLKIKNSVVFEEGKSILLNRAYGHSFMNGNWKETDQNLTSAVLGDGGIYSNTEDIAKWIAALWNNKFLAPEEQKASWTRKTLNNGKPIDYGYGWHIEEFMGSTHPYHDGSSIGFRNNILVFPEKKLMIVLLTNRNEGDPIQETKLIAKLFFE